MYYTRVYVASVAKKDILFLCSMTVSELFIIEILKMNFYDKPLILKLCSHASVINCDIVVSLENNLLIRLKI